MGWSLLLLRAHDMAPWTEFTAAFEDVRSTRGPGWTPGPADQRPSPATGAVVDALLAAGLHGETGFTVIGRAGHDHLPGTWTDELTYIGEVSLHPVRQRERPPGEDWNRFDAQEPLAGLSLRKPVPVAAFRAALIMAGLAGPMVVLGDGPPAIVVLPDDDEQALRPLWQDVWRSPIPADWPAIS